MDQSLSKPVSWVSAPPGSGKTSLVASYLDHCKRRCLWYQVDEGDADIATFFYYMGQAAKNAAPGKRKPLPLLTPECLPTISAFALRYFETLYSRLLPPFAVVLDNYQDVPLNTVFHDLVCNGLSVIPQRINVIVLSRSEPPPAYTRLQAGSRISFLGWDEIRFTVEETDKLVQTKKLRGLAAPTIEQLHNKTQGWAAGLVLMIEKARKGEIDTKSFKGSATETVFNYFASEIFQKADADTQVFLLRTALAPNMDVQMAGRLSEFDNAGRILSELTGNNYFTEKRFHANPVYQYHPLFREFLQSQLKDFFTKDEIAGLQKKTALALEGSGRIEDAVELFSEAKQWPDVARLVFKHARNIIAQGRGKTLEGWLSSIPKTMVEQNPWLLYWLGVCHSPFSQHQSIEHFKKAFELFKTQKDVAGIFSALSGIFEAIAYGLNFFRQFDHWIYTLHEILDEYKSFPSADIEARIVNNMLYAIMYRQPQHPDFEIWEARAQAFLRGDIDVNTRMTTLIALICYRLFSGELEKASVLFNSSREITPSPHISPLFLITLKDFEAFYYWLTSDFGKCDKAAAEGLKLAYSSGVHLIDYFILGHSAANALSAGDIEKAEKHLNKMSSCLDVNLPWIQNLYHSVAGWKALLQKNFLKASTHTEIALKLSVEIGMPQNEALNHLGKALVLYEMGKHRAAGGQIAEVLKICRRVKVYQVEFMCLLTAARFAFAKGDRAALKLLRKGMALGREHAYTNAFYWLPAEMAELCVKALNAGIEVEYVQSLVSKRNLFPDSPPLECESWPWILKVFTFGRFNLQKDGRSFQFSKKSPQKPITMLKTLIAFKGRDVSEHQIADALWPDADADAAHSAFSTTLQRLRQMLGYEKAIQVKEGRVTLDSGYFWVDVWAFGRFIGQAEAAEKAGEIEKFVSFIQKAIDIYEGPFLGEDTGETWAASYRETLRSKFLRSVGNLGKYRGRNGEWEKAIECYKKGLEVDNLAEEFYRQLMICYQQLDCLSDALSVYNRCHKTMLSTLGIEPSPKTKAIYKSIKG
ncbi:MAG: hypothetical protein HZA14_07550 [Nitrospirae bacterium]|nr:hypothetical protein [Nitrospirota bacterium]